MDIVIEPLQHDQIEEYISLQYAAFEAPELDMLMPMIFPRGIQPDLIARLGQKLLDSTKNDPGAYCYCARDRATGELLGISWWETFWNPPATQADADAIYENVREATAKLPPVDGMNQAMHDGYYKTIFQMMAPLTEGKPYVGLMLLATHPKHYRKGVGSSLIKHGLEKADQLKLPVTVLSSRSGRPVYERFGFGFVKDFPFDARDYGGSWPSKHWCLIRPAKP